MKLSAKINWLFTQSGITNYRIAKELNEKTQTLDIYKKDPRKIFGMALERAERLERFISLLSWKDLLKANKLTLTNHSIMMMVNNEAEILNFFKENHFAVQLQWFEQRGNLYLVNFDTYSDKEFYHYPYDLEELSFIERLNAEMELNFLDFLQTCAHKIERDDGRVLYKSKDKLYEAIYVHNNLIDIFEVNRQQEQAEEKNP